VLGYAAIRGQGSDNLGLSLLWLIHLPLCSLRMNQSSVFFNDPDSPQTSLLMKCSVIWVKFRVRYRIELTYILRLPGSFRKLSEDHKAEQRWYKEEVTAAREINGKVCANGEHPLQCTNEY
jgi:hypothetical protein